MEAPKCRLCQNRHWGQCGPDEILVFKNPLQRALESPQAGLIIEHEAEAKSAKQAPKPRRKPGVQKALTAPTQPPAQLSPLTPAFDRSAYQRAYMREYMRKRREVKT